VTFVCSLIRQPVNKSDTIDTITKNDFILFSLGPLARYLLNESKRITRLAIRRFLRDNKL